MRNRPLWVGRMTSHMHWYLRRWRKSNGSSRRHCRSSFRRHSRAWERLLPDRTAPGRSWVASWACTSATPARLHQCDPGGLLLIAGPYSIRRTEEEAQRLAPDAVVSPSHAVTYVCTIFQSCGSCRCGPVVVCAQSENVV